MDKTKQFIEREYFPSQLPPPFSTRSFAAKYRSIERQWVPIRIARRNIRGEFFSVARVGHARRPIIIPKPVPQFFLSQAIGQYWPNLQSHFSKSKISLSRPLLKGNKDRATEIVPLLELADRRIILAASSRFILKTDISKFFPHHLHSFHSLGSPPANLRQRPIRGTALLAFMGISSINWLALLKSVKPSEYLLDLTPLT